MKKIIAIFITLLVISIQCLATEEEGNVSMLPERMQEVVNLLKYHDMNVYRRLQKVDSPLNENELLRLISDINAQGEPTRQRIVEELQNVGDNTHCPEAETMKSNARRQKIIIQKGIHDERDRVEQISESSSYKQSELIVMSPDYKDEEMKHCDTRSNLKRIYAVQPQCGLCSKALKIKIVHKGKMHPILAETAKNNSTPTSPGIRSNSPAAA